MGGIGSGRHLKNAKHTTGSYLALDIRSLRRQGLLQEGTHCTSRWSRTGVEIGSIGYWVELNRIVLGYRYSTNATGWKWMQYTVRVEWTKCNYGGHRPWFRCPNSGCLRRVAVLYGGERFVCRLYNQLVYESQRLSRSDRAIRKVRRLRKRLGPGNLAPWKPKGMHWRTFDLLCAAIGEAEMASLPLSFFRKLDG